MRVAAPAHPSTAPPAAAPDLSGSAADGLVIVVAPANGRFVPGATTGSVSAGARIGQITTRRDSHDVRAPTPVVLQGLLAVPGRLVQRGDALAWGTAIHDESAR